VATPVAPCFASAHAGQRLPVHPSGRACDCDQHRAAAAGRGSRLFSMQPNRICAVAVAIVLRPRLQPGCEPAGAPTMIELGTVRRRTYVCAEEQVESTNGLALASREHACIVLEAASVWIGSDPPAYGVMDSNSKLGLRWIEQWSSCRVKNQAPPPPRHRPLVQEVGPGVY
jgi:hypothetical protein